MPDDSPLLAAAGSSPDERGDVTGGVREGCWLQRHRYCVVLGFLLLVAATPVAVLVVTRGAVDSAPPPTPPLQPPQLLPAQPTRRCAQGPAAATAGPTGTTVVQSLISSEQNRTYRLHLPRGYEPHHPAPLVLAFHGFKNTAADEEQSVGLSALSDSEGFIVVYPEGEDGCLAQPSWRSWNAGGCSQPNGTCCTKGTPTQCQRYKTSPSTSDYCYANCARYDPSGRLSLDCGGCSWCSCADDVRFVSDLLDLLEEQWCIDQRRVFATGFSNGGMLVYTLAQELPHRFAAMAPMAASVHLGHAQPPKLSRSEAGSLAILDLHGVADDAIPGGEAVVSPGSATTDGTWWYEPTTSMLNLFGEWGSCKHGAYEIQ
eukprot:COSAG02_NODE_569_length_20206_cov_5.631223_10_plen_372_part_00